MTRASCILEPRNEGCPDDARPKRKRRRPWAPPLSQMSSFSPGRGNQAAIALSPKVFVRISRSKGFRRKSLAPARFPAIITFSSASTTQ
ncbi:hypothetical protein BSY240_4109 [Agrobacterium sp. RAC06]|nr:hypothetical protein BSY240_4109 [Agrobacterium sp. RAC06]